MSRHELGIVDLCLVHYCMTLLHQSTDGLGTLAVPDSQRAITEIEVSVCIANWNCKEHLRACLRSLYHAADILRFECIVVDNASIDGAPEMVAEEFPHVILIRNAENRGFAVANNQAVRAASGRYLFFLNNDTVLPPESLRRLVDYATLRPEIGMLGPKLIDGEGNLQISFRRRPTIGAMLHRTLLLRWTGLFKNAYRQYRRNSFGANAVRKVEVLLGAAVLMRRDIFDACGGWDEGFPFGVEDVELSVRVGKNHPLVYVPGVEVVHHGRVSSRQNSAFSVPNLLIGYVHYFRKTGSTRLAIVGYKLAVTLDAPLQFLSKGLQFLVRRLRRKHTKADKSGYAARGILHFLTRKLVRFWRA